MLRLALFLSCFVLATSTMTTAMAQTAQGMRMPCHDAGEIAKQLSAKYEEAPVAFGLQSNGNLLQIYASEKKNTWTVVSTTPNGKSCIVAAGKRWESVPFGKEDPMA